MNKEYTEQNSYFIDYISLLIERRKILIICFAISAIIGIVFSLIMPKTYTATAVILPPSGKNSLLSSLPMNLPIGGLGGLLGGGSEESLKLVAILKSRTIAENTIKKFNLLERYNTELMTDGIEVFKAKLNISVEEEGTIEIQYSESTGYFHPTEDENETKLLSKNVTNYIVDEIDRLNKDLQTQQARYNRIFIEKRYNQNKKDLADIEEKLKEFGEKYGIVSLTEQVGAAISAAAELEISIFKKEVELEALKQNLRFDHPEVRKRITELSELRKMLNDLMVGSSNKDSLDVFPIIMQTPELGMEYFRLRREIEIQNQLYEFLTQQYEQAKIQEMKDTPTIQIIDSAVIPERRTKPVRSIFVITMSLIGVFIGVLIIFIQQYFNRLSIRDPKKYSFIVNQVKSLRKDILGRKKGNF